MASVKIKTPDIDKNIKTFLSADYSSGTTLSVISSVSFAINQYIIIGEPGLEGTEITHLVSNPASNTTLPITSLNFSHPQGTPIYYVNWDKYELSYRTDSSQAWNIYANMPASLVFDAKWTEYRDSAATSTYEWRYRYYSNEKSAYSDYSDTIGTTGWSRKSVGYMIREIRTIVNDPNATTVTDAEIIRFLNAAQDKIYTLYNKWWFLLKFGTAIPTVAGQKQYALPSDFGRMSMVSFTYVQGASNVTYNLQSLSNVEFDYEARDNTATSDDNLKDYSIYPGDSTNSAGYLRIWPPPMTAGLSIVPRYYQVLPDLYTYASETLVPIPDILENYAIARILAIRKEDDKSSEFDSMWKEQIQLLRFMQLKDSRPMRSLWRYKGVTAEKRMFGTRDVYSDTAKENYW